MPYSTLFPGQEKNEKIILVLRRHFFTFFKTIVLFIILALIPVLIIYFINNYMENEFSELVHTTLSLLTSLYYIFIVTFFFRSWLDYYLDIWVITSERIVNIEQKGLFSRNIAAHRLYRIQDVTADVKGIIPTFFHYGNVHIQTAGPTPRVMFKQISQPYDVTKKIIALVTWKKQKMAQQGINPDK